MAPANGVAMCRRFQQLPVTAVALVPPPFNIALVGEGSSLKLYDLAGEALIGVLERFLNDHVIHGIDVADTIWCRCAEQEMCSCSDHRLRFLIWGGKTMRVLTIQPTSKNPWAEPTAQGKFTVRSFSTPRSPLLQDDHYMVCMYYHETVSMNDRVLDVKFTSSSNEIPVDGLIAATLTSDNRLYIATECKDGDLQMQLIGQGKHKALFSARIYWRSPEEVVAIVGTVSGHVELWSVQLGGDVSEVMASPIASQSRLLSASFRAHEGSIYGLAFSSTRSKSGQGILIASCSDDRKVRAWHIDDLHTFTSASCSAYIQSQDTGFHHNPSTTTILSMSDVTRKAARQLSGCNGLQPDTRIGTNWSSVDEDRPSLRHQSRVWRVEIFQGPNGDHFLLSASEDCSIMLWKVEDGLTSQSPSCMERSVIPIRSMKSHRGRNIWALTPCIMPHASLYVAAGGADGRVASYNVSLESNPSQGSSSSVLPAENPKYDLVDPLIQRIIEREIHGHYSQNQDSPINMSFGKKANFQSYVLIGADSIVATTRFGHVFLGHIEELQGIHETLKSSSVLEFFRVQWLKHQLSHRFIGWNIVAAVPGYGAIIGGKGGDIDVWRTSDTFYSHLRSSLPSFDQIIALGELKDNPGRYAVLLTSRKKLGVLNVMTLLYWAHGTNRESIESWQVTLHLPENFVVTTATFLHPNVLAVGSRHGKLLFFDPQNQQAVTVSKGNDQDLKFTSALNAVTCILDLGRCSRTNSLGFLTTERDGTVKVFSWSSEDEATSKIQIQNLHNLRYSSIPQLEGAFVRQNELFLLGFKGKGFVVWNCNRDVEDMNVDCSGSGRLWSYAAHPISSGAGCFAWTQASRCFLVKQNTSSQKLIQDGLHGREINCIAINPSSENSFQGLLVTGAEDTLIKLSKIIPTQGKSGYIRTQCTISHHLTGISQAKWSKDGRYLFTAGGAEQLCAWRLCYAPVLELGVALVAEAPRITRYGQLRIIDIDIVAKSMSIKDGQDVAEYMVAAAYSDSSLRVWTLAISNEKRSSFELLLQGTYGHHCLTNVRHFSFLDRSYLFTSSSDGHIAIWKMPLMEQELVVNYGFVHCKSIPVHQSSVKALDLLSIGRGNGAFCVATAGDDNSIAITSVRFESEDKIAIKPVIVPKAHAASVTAILWLPSKLSMDNARRTGELRGEHQVEKSSPNQTNFLLSASNDQTIRLWKVGLGYAGREARPNGDMDTAITRVGKFHSQIADISSAAWSWTGHELKVVIAGIGIEAWKLESTECVS